MHAPANPLWKHFPRYMIAAMALVVAVNVRFIVLAVATFPGAATADDFDTSNRYNAVLAAQARQDALGWQESVSAAGRRLAVTLTGRAGEALRPAAITARAQRPLGDSAPVPVALRETAPGHYEAVADLPGPGQWDVVLSMIPPQPGAAGRTAAGGVDHVRVTRRVIVK